MIDMFTPGSIGGVDFKNRIVRSATWEALADEEGGVTPALVDKIVELARGEVGHIVLGITAVLENGRGVMSQTGIWSDSQVDGHARLVDAVHRAGAKISLQIAHAGGQVARQALEWLEPVAPSAVVHPLTGHTPRALSTDEVKRMVESFGAAATRAARAGYDAVQIHAAHGYLIAQFMSPRFNRRDDEYGEPGRFAIEVYEAVRAEADGRPVHVKINIDDFLDGSTTAEVSMPIAAALSDAGIDAIEVSSGTPASKRLSPSRLRIKDEADEAYFLDLAREVKARVGCPVIGVGGFRSPAVIDRVLASGDIDFVAICRPLIREPGLVRRWMDGDHLKAKCISCNLCFKAIEKKQEGVQCWMELKERGEVN